MEKLENGGLIKDRTPVSLHLGIFLYHLLELHRVWYEFLLLQSLLIKLQLTDFVVLLNQLIA